MLAVNYTTIRSKFKEYCDRITDGAETVIITRKGGKNIVMLSLEQYTALTAQQSAQPRRPGPPSPCGEEAGRGGRDHLQHAAGTPALAGLERVRGLAHKYAAQVRQVFPVDKAVLYGSYAQGDASRQHDVNICFFLQDFGGKRRMDVILNLLDLSDGYEDVFFAPMAFQTAEIHQDDPLIREILATGVEI